MKIVSSLALVTAALAVLTGCDDVLLGYDGSFTGNCDRDPPLTYDNFGQGYVGKWCTGCHSADVRMNQRSGAPLDVNLDTYDDIIAWVERIDERSVKSAGMPPGGGASEAETDKLGEWLRCSVYVDRQNRGDGS